MSYILGIDGGGSKTACILMNASGEVLGRGEASGSNYQSIGNEAALKSIKSAINLAVTKALFSKKIIKIEAICFGLAGVDRPADIEVVKNIFENLKASESLPVIWSIKSSNLVICNDALIALVGGIGNDVGVVVAAGTGSIVFGRNSQGKMKRVGGWGYILGDEGSAYQIAVAGMQAALKAYDGTEMSTKITDNLKHHLNLASIEDLVEVIYRRGWGVKQIAALAPIIDDAAAQGDEVANKIINQAVQELVKSTSTVINSIFTTNEIIEVVTTGSIWQSKCGMRERFVASLTTKYPEVKVMLPRNEPVYGAGLLALQKLTKS